MNGNVTLSPTIPINDFFAFIKDAVRQVISETPGTDDLLITSSEVMKLCKISHPTLQNWRDENIIPFKKIGNKIFYSKKDVLAAVKAKA